MGSTAFVGETASAPLPTGGRVFGAIGSVAVVVGLVGALLGGTILGWMVTPFHYYDALALIFVAIGPAMVVLASFAAPGGTLLTLPAGGPLKVLNKLAGIALVLVVLPGNVVLWLNQVLDRSPAIVETVHVRDTWIRTGRHDGKTYMAGVAIDMPSPLGRWSVYGDQPIRLPQAEWRRLVPGAMLVLKVHRGAIRLPWYEPDPAAATD